MFCGIQFIPLDHGAEMEWFILILGFLTVCAGFSVTAPTGHEVAIRGQSAVLGCKYTVEPNSDFSQLIVTWQRVEDSRVVHSFYYRQDQLKMQNAEYRNRTTLFVSELQNGNASVKIDKVGLRDAGEYLCTVSNNKGTSEARVQLDIGAFYTEPRLTIKTNCSGITVLYESEGYPKPEVTWLGEHNQTLDHHNELTERTDEAGRPMGLYYLRSSYASKHFDLNISFKLRNPLLNQDLCRPVIVQHGEGKPQCGVNPAVIPSVLCVLMFLIIVFLLIMWKKKQLYSLVRTNNSQTSQHRNDGIKSYRTESNGTESNGIKSNGIKSNGIKSNGIESHTV